MGSMGLLRTEATTQIRGAIDQEIFKQFKNFVMIGRQMVENRGESRTDAELSIVQEMKTSKLSLVVTKNRQSGKWALLSLAYGKRPKRFFEDIVPCST